MTRYNFILFINNPKSGALLFLTLFIAFRVETFRDVYQHQQQR